MTMLVNANALQIPLADKSVNMVVTSPPYWGLRDYGTATWEGGDAECDHKQPIHSTRGGPLSTITGGQDITAHEMNYRDTCHKCGAIRKDAQLGLEQTLEEYVANMVAVFREVWRVLRDDGTVWLNLGDSYAGGSKDPNPNGKQGTNRGTVAFDPGILRGFVPSGLKPKDLVGIPWRVAFALQADGWYLRSDIIWAKPNPMPESVTDRPTKAHEYLFLLSKSQRYYYDADAVREPVSPNWTHGGGSPMPELGTHRLSDGARGHQARRVYDIAKGANRRTVWTIPTAPYSGAHFATFPPALVEPCIKAGSRPGGVVFDPFAGSGTTLVVARKLGRHGIGLDLSMRYLVENARTRLELDRLEDWSGGIIDDSDLSLLPLFAVKTA